jgi:SM-20-related protein
MTPNSIAKMLGDNGVCVCPDFLSANQLKETRNDLKQAHLEGKFKRAGIGHGAETQNAIRRDEILWLDREMATAAQQILWSKIDELKQAFNRSLFLGLTKFEGHYAVYPKGGFYKRHLDRFQDHSDRMISFVLYLNQDWQMQDGGHLRIYHDREAPTDIDPLGGTMVCFLSADSEHEVLLNHAPRFSFSGWFKA